MKWNKVRLSEIAKTSSGGTPDRSNPDFWKGSIPWIKSGQLKDGMISECDEFITELGLKKSSASIVDKGTLLLALYGATAGKLAFTDIKATTNQAVCAIVTNDSVINRRYLFYFLLGIRPKILNDASGGAQPNISQAYVKNIQVPLPPLHIQQQIADTLDKADSLRRKDQELLKKYDELAQAIFYDMFGDLQAPKMTLESLVVQGKGMFSNGPFGSDLLTSELKDSGVPVIYIRDIRNGTFIWKSNVYVSEEKARQLQACCVKPDDLLITKVGDPPGTAAIYPMNLDDAIITQDVIRLRLNQDLVMPTYLQYLINSDYGQSLIKPIMQEGTRSRFSLGDFKKLIVPTPELCLQKTFLDKISNITDQKRKISEGFHALKLFNSLMSKSFS